jgi:hypothetical protein
MIALLLLHLTPSLAADSLSEQVKRDATIGVHVGPETTLNDPFLVRRGFRLGVELQPIRLLGVEWSAAGYPSLGQADWAYITKQLVNENQVTPDLSPITWRTQASLTLVPIHQWLSPTVQSSLRISAGGGIVHTEDDLDATQDSSQIAQAVQQQNHAQFVAGIAADVRWRHYGLRWHLDMEQYTETIGTAQVQESKRPLWTGVDFIVAWGAGVTRSNNGFK